MPLRTSEGSFFRQQNLNFMPLSQGHGLYIGFISTPALPINSSDYPPAVTDNQEIVCICYADDGRMPSISKIVVFSEQGGQY
jgi:hypothetical protein